MPPQARSEFEASVRSGDAPRPSRNDWEAAGFKPADGSRSAPAAASEWESAGFRPVEGTNEANRRALAQGAVGGLQQGSMATMGMIAGGIAGTPLGPLGTAAGAALGGTAGMIGGKLMTDLTIGGSETVDPASRPYAVAGETFSAALPFGAAPIALGKMALRLPPSMVGNFVNRIFDTAARSPASFFAVETAAASTAGLGAGIAETYAPGNPFARGGAEIVGGILNPAMMFSLGMKGAKRGLMKIVSNFTEEGRKNSAQRTLRDIVDKAGEDPDVLAALLRDPDVVGNPTPAQRTGSLALAAIEAKIGQRNLAFGESVARRGRDTLDGLESSINLLRRTGDPAAFREAAVQRGRQYRAMLHSLVRGAQDDATAAAQRITSDTEAARSAISTQAREALETVLGEARKAESELWAKIPRETRANSQLTQKAFADATADLLPAERSRIDTVITQTLQDLADAKNQTDVGTLLQIRSRMLANSRRAAGQGDWDNARIFGKVAEGALDDLSRARLDGLPPFLVDDAREFSLALNDTFTRSFAGKSLGRSATGADRLPPEMLLRRALAAGGEAAELQFRELDEATRFMSRMGADSTLAESAAEQMIEAQERFLRLAASRAIDPQTGRASTNRLAELLRRETALFERFPAARAAVQEALTSEQALANLERINKNTLRVVDQQAAFSKIAKFDSPADAIANALNSQRPMSEVNAMAKLAKRGGPEAVAGMRASVLEFALGQSTGGEFSPARVRAALFNPVAPGKPSAIDIMRKNGIMDDTTVNRIQQLLDKADNVVSTRTGRADLVAEAEQMDGLSELIIRIQGAKMGSSLAGGGPMQGHGLIAAQAGSKYLRDLFSKLDVGSLEKVLIEAVENPAFMAQLLESPSTSAAAIDLGKQVHAYLLQAGFRFAAEMSEMGYESQQQAEQP